MKKRVSDIIEKNKCLKNYCSMHVGGVCKMFCLPHNTKQLIEVLRFSNKNKISFFILGNGTNVIFKDSGYDGIVICLNNFQKIKKTKSGVCVGAGVGLFKLNTFLAQNNLQGLEWSYGIPGTIGGAVYMNAGAYENEMGEFVEKVEVIKNNRKYVIKSKKLHFFYRNSSIKQNNMIITRVWLKLKNGNKADIVAKQKAYFSKRKISQPLEFYNSGSIFKKVKDESAGKIIDNLGLKNVKIGGAQVSNLHANFIINKGDATSQDVIDLIEKIKVEVFQKTGKLLEEEVIIVGD